MVCEGIQGQNNRPNRLNHIQKSSMNTVLFVNATIGFSENLFLVSTSSQKPILDGVSYYVRIFFD